MVRFLLRALLFVTVMNVHAADWVVDSAHSKVNFISIKKINIAEVHEFDQIQGRLNAEGEFSLAIDLASTNTHNSVRDERMKQYFFDVKTFSTATLRAKVEQSTLASIAEGTNVHLTMNATLELHGESKPLEINVIITRLVGAKLSVVSAQPVIINVADFSLVSGVGKLMDLAKLSSISHAVPVSFYLILKSPK